MKHATLLLGLALIVLASGTSDAHGAWKTRNLFTGVG